MDGLVFFSFCPVLVKKKHFIVIILKNTYKLLSFQKDCLSKNILQNILYQALLIKMFFVKNQKSFY